MLTPDECSDGDYEIDGPATKGLPLWPPPHNHASTGDHNLSKPSVVSCPRNHLDLLNQGAVTLGAFDVCSTAGQRQDRCQFAPHFDPLPIAVRRQGDVLDQATYEVRIHPVCDAGSSRGGGDVDVPPVPGQEFIQVRCGMISDAAQDIGQPGAGIDVVQLSCCDQRVHGSGALPAAIGRGLIVPWFRSQNLRSDIRSIR